jgi:ABC-type transport system involved in cytochrome c biogenesis permease subunit
MREPLLRLIFVLAVAFTLFMALDPAPPALPIDRLGDKAEHMMAFATLSGLAWVAFRRVPWWQVIEHLSFLGALVEVFQSIPSLHRDCDPLDWIADTFAIICAVLLCRWLLPERRVPLIGARYDD